MSSPETGPESKLPLSGRRILVTRAAHQAGKLSDALRELGAEPVEVPVLEIRPPATFEPLDRALRQLDTYNWLIFTSANAVRALVERTSALGLPIAQSPSIKVAAIGPATASAACDAGFLITFVPESYVAESLVDGVLNATQLTVDARHSNDSGPDIKGSEMTDSGRGLVTGHDFSRAEPTPQKEKGALAPARILIVRAKVARDIIPDVLRAAGAEVDVVEAYQNAIPESAPQLVREALATGLDAATFTSSSSVLHLAEVAKKANIAFPFKGIPAISIGPITTQTLREANWLPAAEASQSDIPGLVAAVAHFFKG